MEATSSATYRLSDKKFSREWRRSKNYSRNELRWLARRKGLEFVERHGAVQLRNKAGKPVANFGRVPDRQESAAPRTRFFAALALGRVMG